MTQPHPNEQMPDGSARSGLSQAMVGEIVRERAAALVEVEQAEELLVEAREILGMTERHLRGARIWAVVATVCAAVAWAVVIVWWLA